MACPALFSWVVRTHVLVAISAVLAVLAIGAESTAVLAQQGWEPEVERSEAEKAAPAPTQKTVSPLPPARPAPAPATAPRLPLQAIAVATVGTRKGSEAPPLQTVVAKQYCATVGEPAAEARFAWQRKVLVEMEAQVDKRIALLEEKIADYQTWVTRRDEFIKRAQDNLVVIYSKMRAEASAQQLAAMDEETAAAVITKLDPRIASTILNEMETKRAARLTTIISGAARAAPAKPANAPAEDKRS